MDKMYWLPRWGKRPDAAPPEECEHTRSWFSELCAECGYEIGRRPERVRTPEVEPVAWRYRVQGSSQDWLVTDRKPVEKGWEFHPLYASPPEVTQEMVLNCLLLDQNDWWAGLKTREDFQVAAKLLTESLRAALHGADTAHRQKGEG